MSERIEFRSNISAAEGIKGIRQSRELRPEEAQKRFSQEFERQLAHEKEKKEAEEDEIIITGEESKNEQKDQQDGFAKQDSSANEKPLESEKLGKNKIDLVA
jgi:hypothetical protein